MSFTFSGKYTESNSFELIFTQCTKCSSLKNTYYPKIQTRQVRIVQCISSNCDEMACFGCFVFYSFHHFTSFYGFFFVSHCFKSIEFLKVQISFICKWIVLQKPEYTASSPIEFVDTAHKGICIMIYTIITFFCHDSISRRTGYERHSIFAAHQLINCRYVIKCITDVKPFPYGLSINIPVSEFQYGREPFTLHNFSISQDFLCDKLINHVSFLIFLSSTQIKNNEQNRIVTKRSIHSQVISAVVNIINLFHCIFSIRLIIESNTTQCCFINTGNIADCLCQFSISLVKCSIPNHSIYFLLWNCIRIGID
ncbi:uncharacterized protein [Blastocystis hominis]|uniref:Uncharacterized protein n=1 Tax=Blastocystis hominis TaxID=12968 RepID=D8M4E6_BLAHO|nr:uncharacterized protein [Blastocystis hominis]CBK22935.2 unnamed protein product [Blastocystis hominis]|eukprot:XP_012896983.1 uncharacterized protein [Blastocystis hominis]